MSQSSQPERPVESSEEGTLVEVRRLLDDDRPLDALRVGSTFGAIQDWPGETGQALAGRVANHAGSDRLGSAIHLNALRHRPSAFETFYFGVFAILNRRGPWRAWLSLHEFETQVNVDSLDEDRQANWLALRGLLLNCFRDFEPAERVIREAIALAPDEAWFRVQLVTLLNHADRHDEALEVSSALIERFPRKRSVLQVHASVLSGHNQLVEAVTMLTAASKDVQSGIIRWQLATLLRELDDPRRMLEEIQAARDLLPLLDRRSDRLLSGLASDAYYKLGDVEQSIEYSWRASRVSPPDEDSSGAASNGTKGREQEASDSSEAPSLRDDFFCLVAKAMARPDASRERILLDLPFVQQHDSTCAPATLTSIARYWEWQVEHPEVAEEICYDGTPWHSERSWAESQGMEVREFRVTLESASALIRAGVPFTLTTTHGTQGHLQAVAGFDLCRRTLLIRDPNTPHVVEMTLDELLEFCASTGPRGMALVPPDQAHRFEGLEFPDLKAYDGYHRVQKALDRHDRDQAVQALEAIDPEHSGAEWARLSLATYDHDLTEHHRAARELLDRYPKDVILRLRVAGLLGELGDIATRTKLLRQWALEPFPDPKILLSYIDAIQDDPRFQRERQSLMRKKGRLTPDSAEVCQFIALELWDDPGQRNFARQAFHFAASLADKNEGFALNDFIYQGESEGAALKALEVRARKLLSLSSAPALTYFEALRRIGRAETGVKFLIEALAIRPGDSQLSLALAREQAVTGDHESARQLLESVRSSTKISTWMAAAADVASIGGDLRQSEKYLVQAADAEPLNAVFQQKLLVLRSALYPKAEVTQQFSEHCARFPHHRGFQEMLYAQAASHDPPAAEVILDRILEIAPENAWAIREKGFVSVRAGALDAAKECLTRARAIDFRSPSNHYLATEIALHARDIETARREMLSAIEKDPDNPYSVNRLISITHDAAQRTQVAEAIFEILIGTPVTQGIGILAMQDIGRIALPDASLLEKLARFRAERPDLSAAWLAYVRHRLEMGEAEVALGDVDLAVARFPLTTSLWIAKADVHRALADRSQQIASLQRALAVDPFSLQAIGRLGNEYLQGGEFQTAIDFLETAREREPQNAYVLGLLAEAWFASGKHDHALGFIERSLTIDSGDLRLWETYLVWCSGLDRVQNALDLCTELSRQRPNDPVVLLQQARCLIRSNKTTEALEVLDRSLAADPLCEEAYDLRAEILCYERRFDEAIAGCSPEILGDPPPVTLRGRAAWVKAQRGDLKGAVREMRAVVSADPHYVWGWTQVCEWASFDGDMTTSLEAADQLIKLSPHDAQTLAIAGRAYEDAANSNSKPDSQQGGLHVSYADRSLEFYRRSHALDPSNTSAASGLLRILPELGQAEEADGVLNILEPHLDPAVAQGERLRLKVLLAGSKDAANIVRAELPALIDADTSGQSVSRVINAAHSVLTPRSRRQARKSIAKHLDQVRGQGAAGHRVAAGELIQWFRKDGDLPKAVRTLKRMLKHPGQWLNGMNAWMAYDLDEGPCVLPTTLKCLTRGKGLIQESAGSPLGDDTWGMSSEYIRQRGRFERRTQKFLVDLARDWPQRTTAQPWMMCNFAEALIQNSQFADARLLIDEALCRPADHYQGLLKVFGGLMDLIEPSLSLVDRRAAARHRLADVQPDDLSNYHRAFYELVGLLARPDPLPDGRNRRKQLKGDLNHIMLRSELMGMDRERFFLQAMRIAYWVERSRFWRLKSLRCSAKRFRTS